jgi:hypothetical protein
MTRVPRVVGTVLLVLAGLLVPVAVIATWTARTVTDTDAFVARVSPVAAQPAVQTVVEQQITETVDRVVIEGFVGSRVGEAIDELDAPPVLKILLRNLASSAGGWAEERVARASHKVVTSTQFQDAFEKSLTVAHGELVGVLEDDRDQVLVAEEQTVSIKVATITDVVKEQLVAAGLDAADRIPEVEATIPIASVDQLEQWRTYYRLLGVLVWLGPVLVVVLAAVGLWLRRDLARAGLWFAGAGVLGTLGIWVIARHVVQNAVVGIVDPDGAAAASAIVRTLTETLRTNARVTLWVLVAVLVVSLVVLVRPRVSGASWDSVRRSLRGDPQT